MFRDVRLLVFVLSGLVASGALAGDWSLNGSVGLESRAFPRSPQFQSQLSGVQTAVLLSPEIRYRSPDGRNLVRFVPNIRIDSRDRERNLFDVTELAWTWVGGDWETLAGINKVFWGVTESRHLVDIINQTDLAEDIDGEEKLGQLMFSPTLQTEWGRLSGFIMTGFRERTFPGADGRLRTPLPVNTDAAEYESSAEEKHVDYALRYSHYLGDWDIGVSVFHGTGREPRLLVNNAKTEMIPFYDQITQFGTDLQYTRDAWLWKFEGIVRSGQVDTFAATVAGFEYTLYQIKRSAVDLGLLVEYLYDGRDDTASTTFMQNDVFTGARLTLNDTQGTSLLAGLIVDVENQSTVFSIEAERRIGDRWTLELESRWFIAVDATDPLVSVENDDYVTLRIQRYF